MSEDTAHGQHFEPPPITGPTNGEATGPQVQQAGLSRDEYLRMQSQKIENLGVRVVSLMDATRDAFESFVEAQQWFFIALSQKPKETNDNRPTNSAATPTSA